MPDREKVIKAIKGCINDGSFCNKCDYDGCVFQHGSCEKDLLNDALALLKEQVARVMTLDEVKSFDWDYCYLEEERLPGKEYREICGDYALTCITWPCIASMRIQHGDDSYGKKWRCWSAKPTDEQRQEVKWDE